MNQIAKNSARKLLQNYSIHGTQRHYSKKSSSVFKFTLLAGSSAVVASTLTLAYAKYDKNFRDQLSSYLPVVNTLFNERQQLTKNSNEFEESFLNLKPKPVITVPIAKPETDKIAETSIKKPIAENVTENDKKPQKYKIDEEELKAEVASTFQKAVQDENNVNNVQQDVENELRIQLKRQLYILQEFYKEQTMLYKTELKRQLEIDLKNKVLQEKVKIANDYDESFKKLKQMEYFLQIRDKLDKQEKASKKLWLLGQTLSNLLEHNRSSLSKDAAPIQISEQIDCIRKIAQENFPDESLIQTVLTSLPENAVKNGVYSEEDLIRRYNKVEKICNQVSLIQDDYTPFYGYLQSFAYSFIRPLYEVDFNLSLKPVQVKQIPQQELDGTLPVDPNAWDTYDILKRVNFSIENRNLEMALRYANQLSGEPRKVAMDWIRDTREYLEVKQAIKLVETKVASINLHQLTFTQPM